MSTDSYTESGVTELAEFKRRTTAGERAWVRVTNPDHNGYVEFQFSLGDPAIFLEMTLPPAAFQEFCATHQAERLSAAEAENVDAIENRWRFGADKED